MTRGSRREFDADEGRGAARAWLLLRWAAFILGWDGAALAVTYFRAFTLGSAAYGLNQQYPATVDDLQLAFSPLYPFIFKALVSLACVGWLGSVYSRKRLPVERAARIGAVSPVVFVLYRLAPSVLVDRGLQPGGLDPYKALEVAGTCLAGFAAIALFTILVRRAAQCVDEPSRPSSPPVGKPPVAARAAWWFLCWLAFVVAWGIASGLYAAIYLLIIGPLLNGGLNPDIVPQFRTLLRTFIQPYPGPFELCVSALAVSAVLNSRLRAISRPWRVALLLVASVGTGLLGYAALPALPVGSVSFFPMDWQLVMVQAGVGALGGVIAISVFSGAIRRILGEGIISGWAADSYAPPTTSGGARRLLAAAAITVAAAVGLAALHLRSRTPPPGPPAVASGRRFTGATRPANARGGDIWVNPKDGAEMVYIPGGPFLMGDDDVSPGVRHTANLSAYWIYKNLVTIAQYKRYCVITHTAMPTAPNADPRWRELDHPMVAVSWLDAMAYCKWAGVTLPSEAQWERAARGTGGRKYAWGDKFDPTKVWASRVVGGDAGGTAPVGKYGLGEYGISDMGGNVSQWCLDWYDEQFWSSRAAAVRDPVNLGVGEKRARALRGGAWIYTESLSFRAAAGYESMEPGASTVDTGFRGAARG